MQDFIRKLNQLTGQNYRLPSEAEWEYAARAGTTTEWSFDGDESKLRDYAWYSQNSGGQTHQVGQKLPNAFGLFDMHGNVGEWTQDCWHENYLDAPTDGSAWIKSCSGEYAVPRGGSWYSDPKYLRSTSRLRHGRVYRDGGNGFRLASDLPMQASGTAKRPEPPTQPPDTKKTNETVQQLATKAGEIIKDCAECPEMVVIPAGIFVMGSGQGSNELPTHTVNIRSFLMGTTEVTQKQWESVMRNNPSFDRGNNLPVQRVSWNDIQLFIDKLNQKTGQKYRLPSESEWEYGARAGTTTEWNFGGNDTKLRDYAWYMGGGINEVGRKLPNAFGLYDVYGNVAEWVEDCWHSTYRGAPSDGSAWRTDCGDNSKVLRGGWNSTIVDSEQLRSASRDYRKPQTSIPLIGFRLARDP
jgi:formylglycine-generating enzyme required for sulfatase activity